MRTGLPLRLIVATLLATPLAAGANSTLSQGVQTISSPAPSYPEPAIEQGIEGVVLLHLVIDERGEPLNVQVRNADANPLLVAAAKQSIRQWRFTPATENGEPVRGSATVPIRFALESERRYHDGSVLSPAAPWNR